MAKGFLRIGMTRSILVFLIAMTLVSGFAQQPYEGPLPIEWPVLGMVKYKPYQTPGMANGEKPEPGLVVKRLNNKAIRIQGFVIPLDIDGNSYMLSAQPNASCFFCGKAGMESVIELKLKEGHRRFEMDEVVTFQGTLLLNDDPYGLMYILQDASAVATK
jgi:hypothetical protein